MTQPKVEQRKMIDTRVKFGNTSGNRARNKRSECVVIKSAQQGFTMAELLVVVFVVFLGFVAFWSAVIYIAHHFLAKFW